MENHTLTIDHWAEVRHHPAEARKITPLKWQEVDNDYQLSIRLYQIGEDKSLNDCAKFHFRAGCIWSQVKVVYRKVAGL